MEIPDEPEYTHGSNGEKPLNPLDYANGDPLDANNFDYFVNTPFEKIKAIINVLNAIDSDGDGSVDQADKVGSLAPSDILDIATYDDDDNGIVNQADGASVYSDDGSMVVSYPTKIDFLDKLTVTDDGDSTVSISTTALDEEEVEDVVNSLLSAGDKLSWSYDDPNDNLTITTTALDQEEVKTWVNNNADVPNADHADSADQADNADTVDGNHANDFADSNHGNEEHSSDFTTLSEVNNNADVPNADHADTAGDANTVDGINSTGIAKLGDGVEVPVFASTSDVPSSITKGEIVYIDEDGLYVEDGS